MIWRMSKFTFHSFFTRKLKKTQFILKCCYKWGQLWCGLIDEVDFKNFILMCDLRVENFFNLIFNFKLKLAKREKILFASLWWAAWNSSGYFDVFFVLFIRWNFNYASLRVSLVFHSNYSYTCPSPSLFSVKSFKVN